MIVPDGCQRQTLLPTIIQDGFGNPCDTLFSIKSQAVELEQISR